MDINVQTCICSANVANDTGTITGAQICLLGAPWADSTNTVLGTLTGSGTSWTYHASANVGTVTKGSTQTYTGLSFAVTVNDCVGVKGNGSTPCVATDATATNMLYKAGNHMTAEGAQTYTALKTNMSLYLTGTTPYDPHFSYYPHILAH